MNDSGGEKALEGLDVRARTVANVGWTGLWTLATQATSFGGGVALRRLLSKTDFGLYELAGGIVGLFGRTADLGLGYAVVQRRGDVERAYETGFVLRFATLVAGTLAIFALAPLFASAYESPPLLPILLVAAAPNLLGAFFFVSGVRLYRDLFHGKTSFAVFAGEIGALGVGVGAALLGAGVWSLVSAGVARLAVNWAVLFAFSPWRPRLRYDASLARELFGFGKFVLAGDLLHYASSVLLYRVLLGKALGLEALGVFGTAIAWASTATADVAGLLARALIPAFARRKEQPEALRAGFRLSFRVTTAIVFPLGAGLAVVAPEFVVGLVGERWSEAAAPMRILCLYGALRALDQIAWPLLHALGAPRVVMRGQVFLLVSIVALLVPGALLFGLLGAAIASTVAAAIATGYVLASTTRRAGARAVDLARDAGRAAAAAAAMAAAVLLLRGWLVETVPENLPRLGLEVALGALVYLAAARVLLPDTLVEVRSAIAGALRRAPRGR